MAALALEYHGLVADSVWTRVFAVAYGVALVHTVGSFFLTGLGAFFVFCQALAFVTSLVALVSALVQLFATRLAARDILGVTRYIVP